MAEGTPSQKADSLRAGAGDEAAVPTASAGTTQQSAAADAEWADRMLGEFRILRLLGHGGMAEVFLAEQTSLKRNVAIKVLRKERLTDASYVKRFKTEAMAAAALSHPNIVQVYMIGEQSGTHFIAQEYVQGMNLREFLAKKGPPEEIVALRIMRQVAGALQAAHAAGIVHRDIKPENILLTRRGEAKVADFGLAQLTQHGEKLNLTQIGLTMGTPLYMSPEQVNGKKVDARSDIYSFGVTCYHMLAGTPPFRGETAMSVAVQHLKEEPEGLEKIRGDVSPLLCRVVRKMMAKDVEKRYQTSQDLLRDLKRVGQGANADVHEQESAAAAEDSVLGEERPSGAQRLLTGLWQSPDWPLTRQIGLVLLVGLIVGAASAGAGWLTRAPDPFQAELPKDTIRKPTIVDQIYFALHHAQSVTAWQEVIDYPDSHPPAETYKSRARQKLAMLYLRKHDLDQADELFRELSRDPKTEFRACGLAGQAVVLHMREDYVQSQNLIQELVPYWKDNKLDDPTLVRLVAYAGKRNVEKMNRQANDELQKLIEHSQQTPDDDSGPTRVDPDLRP